MSVSYADQQSQASSNCDNIGLMLLRNRWTLCVSQTTFLVPLHERAFEIHREKKNCCIFRIHFCAKLTKHSTIQWSLYDGIVHSSSVNVSYVIKFSFFGARAFPWLTRRKFFGNSDYQPLYTWQESERMQVNEWKNVCTLITISSGLAKFDAILCIKFVLHFYV
jgi:hypothetical protein